MLVATERSPVSSFHSIVQLKAPPPRQRTFLPAIALRLAPTKSGASRRSLLSLVWRHSFVCDCINRQRVAAALGAGVFSFDRSNMAVTPVSSAASCSRRLAVSEMSPNSPTTAAIWLQRKPSSIAHSASLSRRVRTRINRIGSIPNCSNAGP